MPSPLRRALRARDQGCRFPGCNNTRYLHAHHIRHWAQGGETALENLVLLCGRHHRLLHEHAYSVELDHDGELRFWHPRGYEIGHSPLLPNGDPNRIQQRRPTTPPPEELDPFEVEMQAILQALG